MAGEREREFQALRAEHEQLEADLARLRGQKRPDFAQHDAFIKQLQAHRQKLADWRKRYTRRLAL